MSENTLKIEIVPNGYLYFEPTGSIGDNMEFIATTKRNSSQDAKVADWFEGTKKQGQSRDFKSVMHTALAASDAVNGGKDKWKVFRAIENYQKAHNLTLTVKPKGQNKENTAAKPQSFTDRVKAVDWTQDNMVVANFRKLFGIVSDQDLEMKMPIRDAGYDARGIAQFEATYTYNGKQYIAKTSGKKKEARKAVIYKILADQFGIGEKEPEKEISKPKSADVEGFKEFIRENLRDTDCRLWFRGVPEEYGIEQSWRHDPQKRVRRSDGGWMQANSAILYLVQKGKQYSFEGLGQSSKDAENAAILKMAKEFCGLDVKAKIAEEKIEEMQDEGNYEELKYLKVLEEREDIYFSRGSYSGGNYYVKTPYGDMAFFKDDDFVAGVDSRLYLRTERDVTPDVLKGIKLSKEEEAEIHSNINARIEEINQNVKNYLIEHKRELNYLQILEERSDVSYWSSLGYSVNIDGGRTFEPGFEYRDLRSYLPALSKQNPEISEVLEAIKISDEEKKEISQDIDDRVKKVIEKVEQEKAAEKAFEDFNENVKAGNIKEVEEYFANGGEVSNEFEDETLRLADSPEMIKLLIKNGAEIVTDNDAYDDDDIEYHSFLVDAIDEIRPDKVAVYLQEGADANFDATDYYYSKDQSVDLALKRIENNEDEKSVTIIKQMIEDARNGKPREEIRLEDYQNTPKADEQKHNQSVQETVTEDKTQNQNIDRTDKMENIEFVGAMDNPHFMERHFNKEAMTIGSKPLPKASEDEMRQIMETMDKEALRLTKEQGADGVIYLSMALDHNIATDAVAPLDCVDKGKVFTVLRDANTPYEKEVRVALISKEDIQKEAATNLIHAIYGPDEGKMVNYTAFFGAMSEPFPRELDKDATPEQIARNEKCKEYWDNHVFLATPEEVQKVVQDLHATAAKTEDKDKAQKYTTAATAASMRVNLFKNMGKKSPLTAKFHSEKADYEISVPQPKTSGNSRNGKGIGE